MTPTRSLGRYRITYKSGSYQDKDLISHDDFLFIIKPKRLRIAELKEEKKFAEASRLGKELLQMFGDDWFTTDSPLHSALKTGVMKLLAQKGGDHKVKIEKV